MLILADGYAISGIAMKLGEWVVEKKGAITYQI